VNLYGEFETSTFNKIDQEWYAAIANLR